MLLAINGLNVVNSFVGRDLMTAIEQRSMTSFVVKAVLYVALFAASTVAAVLVRFGEERLAILWREWLTRRLLVHYLEAGHYYRLKERGLLENPDQRIAEDVRTFTAMTISLALMLLNAILTIVAFAGVLWSISPMLFAAAVAYAAVGSAFTILLGRPLIRLNYDQADREATFRADLVHVRENAESLVLLQGEGHLVDRMLQRLDALATNARRIIAVNRNLGFFTTGYNYGIQIIPVLIVGPMFIRGTTEFGVITQSAMAFSHLLGAFSLIVTQFQSISSYAAVLTRVSGLEEMTEVDPRRRPPIEIVTDADRLAYEGVTLRSRLDGRVLLRNFTMTIRRGSRVLLAGPNEGARVALFRATAGVWETGEGRILRPSGKHLMLVPERPYLPPGTLREVLVQKEAIPDARVLEVLRAIGAESVLQRSGGLDQERDWADLFLLSEHQLLSIARVVLAAPQFAVLHRITTIVAAEAFARASTLLSAAGIGVFELGDGAVDDYDAVVEVDSDGEWRWIRKLDNQVA